LCVQISYCPLLEALRSSSLAHSARGHTLGLDKVSLHSCRGARVSPEQIRPFIFAKLALTDDPDAATSSENVVKALGTIRVEFHRITMTGKTYVRQSYGTEHKQPVRSFPLPRAAVGGLTSAKAHFCFLRRSSTSAARRPRCRTRPRELPALRSIFGGRR